MLISTLEMLTELALLSRSAIATDQRLRVSSLTDVERILAAIERRHPKRAANAMERHILNVRASYDAVTSSRGAVEPTPAPRGPAPDAAAPACAACPAPTPRSCSRATARPNGAAACATPGGPTSSLTDAAGARPPALRPRLEGRGFAHVLASPLSRAVETCELAGLGDAPSCAPSSSSSTTATPRA